MDRTCNITSNYFKSSSKSLSVLYEGRGVFQGNAGSQERPVPVQEVSVEGKHIGGINITSLLIKIMLFFFFFSFLSFFLFCFFFCSISAKKNLAWDEQASASSPIILFYLIGHWPSRADQLPPTGRNREKRKERKKKKKNNNTKTNTHADSKGKANKKENKTKQNKHEKQKQQNKIYVSAKNKNNKTK